MKVFQEVLTLDYSIKLDEILPGFLDKFKDKILIFRITVCHDFEIDLKEEFRNDVALRSEIRSFIKKQYSEINVYFINNQLPF